MDAGSSVNCAVCSSPIEWTAARDWVHAPNFAVPPPPHAAMPRREQPECTICGIPVTEEQRCGACGNHYCITHESRPYPSSACIHTV